MQPEEPNKYVKELTLRRSTSTSFTTDVHTEVIERGLGMKVLYG